MLYRITAVGVIPGINDQVGGNAHGDSDIGVYRFFCVILRTVYDSPVWLNPSLNPCTPLLLHVTRRARVYWWEGANNRNNNSWNHSIPLEISKYHETYKHFNDRTFYLITMTKLRSYSVGHHTGAWAAVEGMIMRTDPPPPSPSIPASNNA